MASKGINQQSLLLQPPLIFFSGKANNYGVLWQLRSQSLDQSVAHAKAHKYRRSQTYTLEYACEYNKSTQKFFPDTNKASNVTGGKSRGQQNPFLRHSSLWKTRAPLERAGTARAPVVSWAIRGDACRREEMHIYYIHS